MKHWTSEDFVFAGNEMKNIDLLCDRIYENDGLYEIMTSLHIQLQPTFVQRLFLLLRPDIRIHSHVIEKSFSCWAKSGIKI